ncbi:MAG: hypothetical protein RM347_017985 [Nostoc sp. ChiQUE02]|uniref:hypothetical protein n=1 Tax=Nostoc sp. ChiQUE02 TaxID=3075377 RepID=UPI002AD2A775|nr:hypothetical protein [Nostoc sp. ChiQUE02]MDZ8233689.1 hypothetical protein [Nostoc sp. ChiQUE02]
MKIPLFSGDAGRSLLIRRGMDSYSEQGRRQIAFSVSPWDKAEGRRLQYSLGFSLRRYANRPTLNAVNLQPALDEVFHVRS